MNNPKNLLIVRTDRIGDLVLTLPLAGIIKKHYPECMVSFLVRDYTKEILNNHPNIDEILILKTKEDKTLFLKNLNLIKKKNYDSVIIASPTFKISLILFLSKILNRIGTGYRWYSFMFNRKMFVHRKYAEKHELEFNIELLKEIGIEEKVNIDNVNYSLQINDSSQKKVDANINSGLINNSNLLVIIHPGSGNSSVDLPISKFKDLTQKILININSEIIITGSSNEKYLCEQLIINDKVHNYAGIFNLSELIALIDKCHLFISNSTGPLHIASALNKNVIGFYPNLLTCSSKRWGPYTSKFKVFTPPLKCNKCEMEQCDNKDCMNNIDMNDVINYIKNIKSNFS